VSIFLKQTLYGLFTFQFPQKLRKNQRFINMNKESMYFLRYKIKQSGMAISISN
jgi:hypothetical protein